MRLAIIPLLALAACADQPKRPDVCDVPYGETIMECRREPKQRDMREYVPICDAWGRCEWVPRADVHRILRQIMGGPR